MIPPNETAEDWKPVSKAGVTAWLVFYGLFLLYALLHRGPGLFIDLVFLPIHEGGHLLFSYFGETLHVLGGTLLQLFVPAALALCFWRQGQVYGAAFSAFFFFENFLNIATYMADARFGPWQSSIANRQERCESAEIRVFRTAILARPKSGRCRIRFGRAGISWRVALHGERSPYPLVHDELECKIR